MAALYEIPVISAPFQRLTTVLSGKAVAIELTYNATAGRWHLDLSIEGVPVLKGRRLVTGADLLRPFRLGVGKLAVVDWAGQTGEPGRDTLPSGAFRLMQLAD